MAVKWHFTGLRGYGQLVKPTLTLRQSVYRLRIIPSNEKGTNRRKMLKLQSPGSVRLAPLKKKARPKVKAAILRKKNQLL